LLANVESASAFDTTASVYNFEVEKTHTYYVGTEGVLVHNQCGVGALSKIKTALSVDEWKVFQDLLINSRATTAERLVFYKELVKLDDVSLKAFFNDFKAGGLTFQRGIIKEVELIEVWKNVKYLAFAKYDIEFLKWLDKAKKSHLPTHLLGEINARGDAVGCHLQSAIDNVRVKILPTPPPVYIGTELKTAKIEINGTAKKALSSFFPKSWDEARVLEEVALIIKNPANQVNTNIRLYRGLASDGITNIEIRLTGSSNNLIFDTAFPF
jgi:Bacterial EndoU nuclease